MSFQDVRERISRVSSMTCHNVSYVTSSWSPYQRVPIDRFGWVLIDEATKYRGIGERQLLSIIPHDVNGALRASCV